MYIGEFVYSIDPKNRIFLPVDLRGRNVSFIITRGLEGCLYLFDKKGWAGIINKLENLSLEDKTQERAFKRAMLSGAHEVTVDSQGRILIPQGLKENASIKGDVVILGVGTRIEIWDQKRWKKYYAETAERSYKKLSTKLEI
ncbi:MAG: division/cell wall cluster transcriptional repressor MraZ [Endomicrobiales bacterium]|nr:division/cell wall cluster transcriptional repressor MraZ [Endomicrobiales bacterium]